jgi:hypothetical protein
LNYYLVCIFKSLFTPLVEQAPAVSRICKWEPRQKPEGACKETGPQWLTEADQKNQKKQEKPANQHRGYPGQGCLRIHPRSLVLLGNNRSFFYLDMQWFKVIIKNT